MADYRNYEDGAEVRNTNLEFQCQIDYYLLKKGQTAR